MHQCIISYFTAKVSNQKEMEQVLVYGKFYFNSNETHRIPLHLSYVFLQKNNAKGVGALHKESREIDKVNKYKQFLCQEIQFP